MMSYNLNFTVRGEQYIYPLTALDRLDLIRAVAREGKPYDAVTWSLIQRFAWLYPRGYFDNLSTFVKAYAQPINPRWFPTGDKYLAYIRQWRHNATRVDEAERRAENRLEYANADLEEISSKYIDIVDGVLQGNIKNPVPGAIHYITSTGGNEEEAAKAAQLEFAKNRNDLSRPVYYGSSTTGYNWFFTVPGSSDLITDILSELAPTNIANVVNLGTKDSPATALVFLLFGAAAKQLAEELIKKNG